MKMIKQLTKANASKYGIDVREDLNFKDDGSSFKGFSYKGMPMTQCRADGTTYLAIRVDYLNNNFTLKEWMQTEEYKLEDEFNGCSEVDVDKLIANLEAIIAKVDEMNAQAKVDEVALARALTMAMAVIDRKSQVVDKAKRIEWWKLDRYDLQNVQEAMKYTVREIEGLQAKINNVKELTILEAKKFIENVEYAYNREDGYFVKKLIELINR